MTRSVDFLFDYGSPAAYLAWTQLDKLAADTGAPAPAADAVNPGEFGPGCNASSAKRDAAIHSTRSLRRSWVSAETRPSRTQSCSCWRFTGPYSLPSVARIL